MRSVLTSILPRVGGLIPLGLAATLAAAAAYPAAPPSPTLVIQGQAFVPQELAVPAGVKLPIVIRNNDDLPAEFESYDLSREVVVPGHSEVKIYLGPLDPGRYRFFNDFHPSSEGWVVVQAQSSSG